MGADHSVGGSDDGKMAKFLGNNLTKNTYLTGHENGDHFGGESKNTCKCMIVLRVFLY